MPEISSELVFEERPEGSPIDVRGCPVDLDGDGVPDVSDACPGTPGGTPVDAKGCAADADGDGVHDGIDTCPGTPAETQVDGKGCALPTPATSFESGATKIILEGVRFNSGGAKLTAESRFVLDPISNELRDQDDLYLEVGGHTDSTGDAEQNLQLALRRAQAVRDYMLNWGIPAVRLRAKGYGETQPIADNATEEGRARNRRVELKRIEP